jgi:hypothetical protein
MISDEQIKKLRKKLYVAVRATIAPALQNDSELVKIRRDSITLDMFNKTYDEMNEVQLIKAINFCGKLYQIEFPELAKQTKPVTARQLRMLRFFAIACALEYADFNELIDKNSEYQVYTDGEQFRNALRFQFTSKKSFPDYVVRYMFETWINPKCNQFLIEGGFKKETKNSAAFNMSFLTVEQAQALITRFNKIHEAINKVNDFAVEFN